MCDSPILLPFVPCQVLHFLPYKSHGPVLLAEDHTHFLLEQLEHAQMQLATMLMSQHIAPLKEEAAQWAMKLASVAEILQQVGTLGMKSYFHSVYFKQNWGLYNYSKIDS